MQVMMLSNGKSLKDSEESRSPGPGALWEAWIEEMGVDAGRLEPFGSRWFVLR